MYGQRLMAVGAAVILGMATLGGCANAATAHEIPELLEPVEITLTGKKVVRGDIQDIEAYKGSVKADSISYAFPQGCRVEDMTVHVGQYVEKGDLIAKVNTEEFEKELADLGAEISYLKAVNSIETRLADIQIQNAQIDLGGMRSGSSWYDDAKKAVDARIEQRHLIFQLIFQLN